MSLSGRNTLARLASAALDLVAPPLCLACREADGGALGLCAACRSLLPAPRPGPCPRCAGTLGPGARPEACVSCARLSPRFTRAVAAGPYGGFLGELVRRAKYGRDPLLALPLGALLAEAVSRWDGARGVAAVVPVPSTRRRLAERGFHLADLLAARAARALGVPCRARWLARVGEPLPQAALPRAARRLAARGTVRLREPCLRWLPRPAVDGRVLLLVDDVLTTGATADACARVLLEAGAAEVRVAVAARA